MIFDDIKSGVEVLDEDFNLIYPKYAQKVAKRHFSPIKVARLAALYLVKSKDTKILDVGSGVGKFCLIGAACTEGSFFGVEQRKNLVGVAKRTAKRHNLTNATFINANITTISFKDFDAFYIFNPFYENISTLEAIDYSVELSSELFQEYSLYVREQLDTMPIGTRLATYFSFLVEVPDSYEIRFTAIDDKLKMWEKVS